MRNNGSYKNNPMHKLGNDLKHKCPSIWSQIWNLVEYLIQHWKNRNQPAQQPQPILESKPKTAEEMRKEAQDNAELLLSIYITELRKKGLTERRIRRIVKTKFNIVVK